jgi:hypothetical protein
MKMFKNILFALVAAAVVAPAFGQDLYPMRLVSCVWRKDEVYKIHEAIASERSNNAEFIKYCCAKSVELGNQRGPMRCHDYLVNYDYPGVPEDHTYERLIHIAAKHGKLEILKYFIETPKNDNVRYGPLGLNPNFWHHDVSLMINDLLPLEKCQDKRRSIFMIAVENDYPEMVAYLLQNKNVDKNLRNKEFSGEYDKNGNPLGKTAADILRERIKEGRQYSRMTVLLVNDYFGTNFPFPGINNGKKADPTQFKTVGVKDGRLKVAPINGKDISEYETFVDYLASYDNISKKTKLLAGFKEASNKLLALEDGVRGTNFGNQVINSVKTGSKAGI